MPVFFFHLVQDDQRYPDLDGIERPDLAAVRKAAIEGARSLVVEAVMQGERVSQGRFEIEDEHGATVLTLTFSCSTKIEVTELQPA